MGVEVAPHHATQRLGVEPLAQRRRADDVGEHHGDDLPVSATGGRSARRAPHSSQKRASASFSRPHEPQVMGEPDAPVAAPFAMRDGLHPACGARLREPARGCDPRPRRRHRARLCDVRRGRLQGRSGLRGDRSVTNLASRFADEATAGQILITQRLQAEVEDDVEVSPSASSR